MASKIYQLTPEELQNLLDTSNSYADVLRKLHLTEHGSNPETLKKIIKEYGLNETQLNLNRSKLYTEKTKDTHYKVRTPLEDVLSNKAKMQSTKLLDRLVEARLKEYKCEKCGINDWQGRPIRLQLNHIDGNHYNNELSNLEILCPNCHSQTDTYAGKNCKNTKRNKPPDGIKLYSENSEYDICPICGKRLKRIVLNSCSKCKQLLKAKEKRKEKNPRDRNKIIELYEIENKSFSEIGKILQIKPEIAVSEYLHSKNVTSLSELVTNRNELKEMIRHTPFVKIGEKYGVSDKTIVKWCKKYNLPYKASDIKKYSDEEWNKL